MTPEELRRKYPNIPKDLEYTVNTPFYGCDGGNAYSPIWFCGLEWGGGYTKEEPFIPEEHPADSDEKLLFIPSEYVKYYLRGIWKWDKDGNALKSSNSGVYKVYLMLLLAIISGKVSAQNYPKANLLEVLDKVEDQFKFFSEGSYGFLMNAFTISMSSRDVAEKDWQDPNLVKESKDSEKSMSFAEWSTIPTFTEYLGWCTTFRRHTLSTIRKKFRPSLIYCAGASERDKFLNIWTDPDEKVDPLKEVAYERPDLKDKRMIIRYTWLDNGPDVNPTALIVGPFYSGRPSTLNYWDVCGVAGNGIRSIMAEKYKDAAEWLQADKFQAKQIQEFVESLKAS